MKELVILKVVHSLHQKSGSQEVPATRRPIVREVISPIPRNLQLEP